MSRVGRKVVVVPKGELSKNLPEGITIKTEGDKFVVHRADDSRENRAKHGLVRAHLANMVKGVTDGWTRELEINGVGYRAEVAGQKLTLALGFSHPVVYEMPKGIGAKIDKNLVILSGSDRELLGEVAAKIRSFRPPEPYKGKGVKYVEETIRRKVGKTGAS